MFLVLLLVYASSGCAMSSPLGLPTFNVLGCRPSAGGGFFFGRRLACHHPVVLVARGVPLDGVEVSRRDLQFWRAQDNKRFFLSLSVVFSRVT